MIAMSITARRLRGHGLLAGWRGRPGGDVEALAEVVSALSRLMAEAPESCQEIELNPVRVGPDGALAVDGLIHLDAAERHHPTPTTIQEMA